MSGKPYKALLGALVVVLLLGAGWCQRALTYDRDALGLNRYTELKGAPPVLALTTVALGGFRGLISNALWIRASDLQDEDKYFEMVQLADWITKLEPHFTQVWLMQGWNMAYNISVKFKDPEDRWRWVKQGIELLRDEGLKYNPYDVLIHRELAWFFQHKMGANLDDAHLYYKYEWAQEMEKIFGRENPNWPELIHPTTNDARRRAALLRDTYKMDPAFMKQLDDEYGPLEWRLPEASAIYWAADGLRLAAKNERKIDPNDLITLRRVIYQSMQMSFVRGRLIRVKSGEADRVVDFAPNLAIIPKVNQAYLKEMVEDPKNRDHIETAHRNWLLDAVYFLSIYDHQADAIQWYKYLCQRYPDKPLLENQLDSLPAKLSLDDFVIGRIQGEVSTLGHDKTRAILEGLETESFRSLAMDNDEQAAGLHLKAQLIYDRYQAKISVSAGAEERLQMPALNEMRRDILRRLLSPEDETLPPELKAVLATKTHQTYLPSAAPVNPNTPSVTPGNTNAPSSTPTNK